MPPKSKGSSKSYGKYSAGHSSGIPSEPPAPFTKAPAKLLPFLSDLPKNHIYITNLDNHPPDFKKNIFLVPLALNVGILLLVLWRIKAIAPFYTKMALAAVGYINETVMTPKAMTWPEIITEIAKRSGNFFLDFGIYMLVLPWPQAFFVGTDFGTPLEWRWAVRFRDQEIVVRRSKRWYESLGDVVIDQSSPGHRQFVAAVRLAVSKTFMQGKTGYSLLNKEWDLDFLAMTNATSLVDKKELSLEDFDTAIYVHTEAYGWLVFETQEGVGSDEEAQRRKIIAFKDALTEMGKENLFFKWIELIQYESTQPGGFGPERQAKTIDKAKAMFETQGVDFEAFWRKVGGMDGLPGMEQFR